MPDQEIPNAQIKVSQKLFLLGVGLVGIFMLAQTAAQPHSPWDWFKFLAACGYAALMPVISRLVPTEQQQGARLFAQEAIKRLSDHDVAQIATKVENAAPGAPTAGGGGSVV